MKEMHISDKLPTMADCDKTTYCSNRFNVEQHSFNGQDNYVIDITNGKKKGFFIDIGANHPIIGSNSYNLENIFEWTGILVESNKGYFDKLKKERTAKLCGYCIVSEHKEPKGDDLYRTIGEIMEECTDIIPSFIDYMSIDIDDTKMHYVILNQINFAKYTVGILTVEHALNVQLDAEKSGIILPNNEYRRKIHDLMLDNGYIYDGNSSVDDAYLHKSMYEKYRMNKNLKYDWSLRFDL